MFFANSNLIPKVFYLFLIHNIAELKSDKWSWERGWLHVTCKKNYFTFYLDPWVNFFPLKSGWIAFQIQKNCLVIEARKYFTASCFWGQHSHTKIGNIPKRYNNASKKKLRIHQYSKYVYVMDMFCALPSQHRRPEDMLRHLILDVTNIDITKKEK